MEFTSLIVDAFPKLQGAGGFELLRCKPNTRELMPVTPRIANVPKLLRKRIGNGRVYIRPLQRDLALDPVEDLYEVKGVSGRHLKVCLCSPTPMCDCYV